MMKLTRRSMWVMVAVMALSASVASAQEVASASQQTLKKTTDDLNRAAYRSKALRGNINKTERELGRLKNQTRTIARQLQNYERDITRIETRLDDLEAERDRKHQGITENQKYIDAMLGAMVKMGRTPPYAVLLMPDGLKGKIQAARALGLMSDEFRVRALALTKQLEEIETVHQDIVTEKDALEMANKQLLTRRHALSDSLKHRKNLMEALYGETAEEQKTIAALKKKSHDLQSLIQSLETRRKQKEAGVLAKAVPILKPTQSKSTAAATSTFKRPSVSSGKLVDLKRYPIVNVKGKLHLPAAGSIIRSFGKKRDANDTLKGIEIKTRAGAPVTSVYAGEVMFTGPFLAYGKMVIIRHSHQYHTLLAGLENINVKAGQFLLEGEPIGAMDSRGMSHTLYMELRKNGKPINPEPWIAGYRSHLARAN